MTDWLCSRLRWHTTIALVIFISSVLAPTVLLMQPELGTIVCITGVALLSTGVSALTGAGLSRLFDSTSCSALRLRCLMASAWILNPVYVMSLSILVGYNVLCWWSGLPLAVVVAVLSGRVQIVDADPNWRRDGCFMSPPLCLQWLVSRMIFVAVPISLLSIQVALYLPSQPVLPDGPEIGLIVCGSCILIAAKFFAMCACLGSPQRCPQALVLGVLLSADWISVLHLMELVPPGSKSALLLGHLLAAGVVELRTALVRLRLRPRWKRALAARRARIVGVGGDAELGAYINTGPSLESSDSEDDWGPRSLPNGFHNAIVRILGIPPASSEQPRREFLCGPRPALVVGEDVEPTGASSSAVASLEIVASEKTCVVCQEDIKTGEPVRPLPKCGHRFHAHCLERWASTMREDTRCPTCRRPALARRQGEGGTAVSSLSSSRAGGSYIESSSSRSSAAIQSRDAFRWRALLRERDSAGGGVSAATVAALAERWQRLPQFHITSAPGSDVWEFEVVVEKDGPELGLDVVQHDTDSLIVSRVKPGPLMVWNRSNPEMRLCQGDRIIGVNGHRGNADEIISEIRRQRSLQILVRRLMEFSLSVHRQSGLPMGLSIEKREHALRIVRIGEGPFENWNSHATLDLKVRVSDSIVEVNGLRGTSAELLDAINASDTHLELVLVRSRGTQRSRNSSRGDAAAEQQSIGEEASSQGGEGNAEQPNSQDQVSQELPVV